MFVFTPNSKKQNTVFILWNIKKTVQKYLNKFCLYAKSQEAKCCLFLCKIKTKLQKKYLKKCLSLCQTLRSKMLSLFCGRLEQKYRKHTFNNVYLYTKS